MNTFIRERCIQTENKAIYIIIIIIIINCFQGSTVKSTPRSYFNAERAAAFRRVGRIYNVNKKAFQLDAYRPFANLACIDGHHYVLEPGCIPLQPGILTPLGYLLPPITITQVIFPKANKFIKNKYAFQ